MPEKVKETFDKADDINFCFYDYSSFIGKAIRNGIPLEIELEKIKGEMIKHRDNDKNDYDFEIGAMNNLILILDKHISELKGELICPMCVDCPDNCPPDKER